MPICPTVQINELGWFKCSGESYSIVICTVCTVVADKTSVHHVMLNTASLFHLVIGVVFLKRHAE